MTEIQDEICDRLVGAAIGPEMIGGPLLIAARVVDPALAVVWTHEGALAQFARVLGWPPLFCRAVSGANSALGDETDRRAVAITLFAKLRTGQDVKVTVEVCRDATAWACVRAHASACGEDCPLHPAAVEAVEAARAGATWPFTRSSPYVFRRSGPDCRSAAGLHLRPVTPRSTPAHHAVVALKYLFTAMRVGKLKASWPYALREAAKAEAKARGPDGAADPLLTLAARLGMTA